MGWVFGAVLLAAPPMASAAPVDLFYERTVMTAADARCRLFAPEIGAALAAGQAQARGAALRAGSTEAELVAVEARARAKARSTGCKSPDMTLVATRVREAFDGFARISRMTYPGEIADWMADRGDGRMVRWRLAQTTSQSGVGVTFGLAGRQGVDALLAVAHFRGKAAPYTARLVLRDTSRTTGPYLDTRASKRRLALSKRLPRGPAVRVFAAEARSPAGEDLLPKGVKTGWAFRFPSSAARAMAGLDPREAVAIEFVFAGERDEVRRVYVEVGDFAAGRAFLQVAGR